MQQMVFELERMSTPCGELLFATDEDGNLRVVEWDEYRARMEQLLRLQYPKQTVRLQAAGRASDVRRALQAYFAGELHAIDAIAVRTGGTPFQREVWAALRTIPTGTTMSYRDLAAQVGRPDAMRAVGLANGANPTGVVVPCHRVIGADGTLTGYGGGLERKRWLLEHEGVPLGRPRRAA
jgi:methylated-DNA-[protein]-cysteine S-methyltransferase